MAPFGLNKVAILPETKMISLETFQNASYSTDKSLLKLQLKTTKSSTKGDNYTQALYS